MHTSHKKKVFLYFWKLHVHQVKEKSWLHIYYAITFTLENNNIRKSMFLYQLGMYPVPYDPQT